MNNPTIVGELIQGAIALMALFLTYIVNQRMKAGTAKDVALELIAASSVVARDISQRLKPDMVAQNGGELMPADAHVLKSTAIENLKDQLTNSSLKHIEKNSRNVDLVLGRAIEAAVSKQKDEKPPLLTVVQP